MHILCVLAFIVPLMCSLEVHRVKKTHQILVLKWELPPRYCTSSSILCFLHKLVVCCIFPGPDRAEIQDQVIFVCITSLWENCARSSSDPVLWLAPCLRPVLLSFLWLRDHRAAGRALSSFCEGKSIPDLIRPQHIPFTTTPKRAPVLMLVTVHFREHLLPDPSTLTDAADRREAERCSFILFLF